MVDGDGQLRPASTATTETQETYYGQPVIKAPHWRWLVINYFFLGAIAGGSFAISALTELFSEEKTVSRSARYLSAAALVPSPVLLTVDLGRPERALNMLRILKLRSPMSLGSWALAFLGLFASIAAGLQLLSDLAGKEVLPSVRRLASLLGLPFALFISGYTGVLLAATNVPLWARNHLLMGPTFVASAFSSSFAALTLLLGMGSGERPETATRVARAEAISLSAELALLTASIFRLGRLGRSLTRGRWGRLFWPVTFVGGIVIPLTIQLSGPAQGRSGMRGRRIVAALLTLTGGYVLRMLMIFAGRDSAASPPDYFEYTKAHPSTGRDYDR